MHTSRIIVIGNDIDPDESTVTYIESKLLLLMQYK